MAKITYLDAVNRILRRINATEVNTVTGMTGKAKIIGNMWNEAQLVVMQEDDWYDLYATDTFTTADGTAEYASPTDLNKTIDMMDITNNDMMREEHIRSMDGDDPNGNSSDCPSHFTVQGQNYRLHPIPNGAYSMRTRYWKIPATMTDDDDQSDLPYECEVPLIAWTWAQMLVYLNSFEKAKMVFQGYVEIMRLAVKSNRKRIDKLNIFCPSPYNRLGLRPTRRLRLAKTLPTEQPTAGWGRQPWGMSAWGGSLPL